MKALKAKCAPLIFAAVVMFGGSFAAVVAQNTLEKPLVVEVKSATGQPLKHACVTYVPKNGEVQFRNADEHGRVEFRNLTAGEGRVVAKVSGYTAQKKSVVVGTTAETIAFALEPRR